MGKLIILSLDESEKGIYDKILEIVNEADISIDRKLDESQSNIQIGGLSIMPRQYKVIKQGKEINLTNIEFRILYVLALHQGITLSKEKIYNYVWNGKFWAPPTAHCFVLLKGNGGKIASPSHDLTAILFKLSYHSHASA